MVEEEKKLQEDTEELKPEENPAAEGEAGSEARAAENAESGAVETEAQSNADAQKQEEDLQNKYLRVMAEYQNFRTRTAKEKQDIYAFANEKIIIELLNVIDNFERAMDAKPAGDKFADGMELILKQLLGVLEKNAVKEIEALGQPFDPNFHNAVMTEAAENGTESGTVTKVLQKGYVLNSKVIRAAMVAVAE